MHKSVYALRDVDALRARATTKGSHIGAYAERLLGGPLPWTKMRQAYALLALCDKFGEGRVEAICQSALAFDVVDVSRLTKMLKSAAKPTQGDARATLLRSPWDLCFVGETLLVAIAGSHQIAGLDLSTWTLHPHRRYRLRVDWVDGSFEEATFSQPSGLDSRRALRATWPTARRAVSGRSTSRTRRVRTVVGRGLFDFGDCDGTRDVALLQHCIGIAADGEGRLVVADTYNGKLRRVDARTGEVRTVAAGLNEPSGLSWNPAREASGSWPTRTRTASFA